MKKKQEKILNDIELRMGWIGKDESRHDEMLSELAERLLDEMKMRGSDHHIQEFRVRNTHKGACETWKE